jgi:hypothetical protein
MIKIYIMKILSTVIVLLFFCFGLRSQNNDVIVYSLESEPFYVVVNGIRQNDQPATNVRVENLKGDFHRLRVIFANEKYGFVDQGLSFMEANTEVKIELIFKRGKFKTRFRGENKKSLNQSNEEQVVTYHDQEQTTSTSSSSSSQGTTQGGTSTTNQTSTHVEVESSQETSSSATSVKIEINGQGINSEIKHPGIYQSQPIDGVGEIEIIEGEVEETYQFMANGSMCSRPTVTQQDYMNFRYKLEEINMFDREKSIVQFFSENCMTSAQVAGIVQMDYSAVNGYEVAKHGYRYTWDTENYSLVVASLENKSEQQKLVTFLDVGVEGGAIETPSIDQSTITTEVVEGTNNNYSLVEGYTGGINCGFNQFVNAEAIKKAADEEDFAADKMQVIRLKSQNQCFTVKDVQLIAETFTHESDKIDFLELIFYNTYDVADFYKVFNVLTHSASKEEVAQFITEHSNKRSGAVKAKTTNNLPSNYAGKIGSYLPIIHQDDLIEALSEQVFQKDKLIVIQLVLNNYSMTTNQFIEAAQASFTSEKDILEFARMAKSNIYDIDNFQKVREIFSFNSSKKEFDELLAQ